MVRVDEMCITLRVGHLEHSGHMILPSVFIPLALPLGARAVGGGGDQPLPLLCQDLLLGSEPVLFVLLSSEPVLLVLVGFTTTAFIQLIVSIGLGHGQPLGAVD
jgi:hypothetical protein